MENNDNFISLLDDVTFKTIWLNGNSKAIKFMKRVVSFIVGYDISDFELYMNELGVESKYSRFNKVDILLVSNDKLIKINVELNPVFYKTLFNRNDSFIYKIAGDFYAGNDESKKKYKDKINVEQVNINGFYNRENKKIAKSTYVIYDLDNKLVKDGIKIHNVYLPQIKKMWYDSDDESYRDLLMFTTANCDELERIAGANPERRAIVGEIRRLTQDESYLAIKGDVDLHNAMLDEAEENGFEQGIAQGLEQGIEYSQKEVIKTMYNKGISKDEIHNLTEFSLEVIEETLDEI